MEAAADRLAAAHERDSEPADSGPREQEETPAAPQTSPRLREPAMDYQRASREALEPIGTGTAFLVDLQEMVPRLHLAEFTDREVRAILGASSVIWHSRSAGPREVARHSPWSGSAPSPTPRPSP